jgi:hypothetical protein
VEILGIAINPDTLWSYAWEMMARRVKGAKRKVKPGAEVEIDVGTGSVKKRKKRRASSQDTTVPLTRWLEGYQGAEDKR